MQLGGLPAEGRDTDGVLEEPARVGVVVVRCRRVGAQLAVGEHGAHARSEAGVRDLGDEELEEAVELVGVAARGGRQRRRVDVGALDRADVELETVAEPLHAPEHTNRVALAEARVEELDVVPDARVDPTRRVDELEGEIRRAVLRPQLALALDREDALDDPVLGQLHDRHRASLVPGPATSRRAMSGL